MAMVYCPECGTKISERALTCPHCGYVSENSLAPIASQEDIKPVPMFHYDISELNPEREHIVVLPYDQNKKIHDILGTLDGLKKYAPTVADAIIKMANRGKTYVAEISPYIQDLIEKGIYRINVAKDGSLLPTIVDDAGKIVKQVRLTEKLESLDLMPSVQNLQNQAQMAKILDAVEHISVQMLELHEEMQNDRIAKAEGAWDLLLQASKIEDPSLKEMKVMEAISEATKAKHILMNNFEANLKFLDEHSEKGNLALMFEKVKKDDMETKSSDAFQALVAITQTVQVECQGYAIIGEKEPVKECLKEFNSFIESNKLDDKDTLLLLNENSASDCEEVVDRFIMVAEGIGEAVRTGRIEAAYESALSIEQVTKSEGEFIED